MTPKSYPFYYNGSKDFLPYFKDLWKKEEEAE
jgi:hypothetical protein